MKYIIIKVFADPTLPEQVVRISDSAQEIISIVSCLITQRSTLSYFFEVIPIDVDHYEN